MNHEYAPHLSPIEQHVQFARSQLEMIGHELMNEITLELMGLAGLLSECEKHPGVDVTIGGIASITYRMCDVFKETGTLGYGALTVIKDGPDSEPSNASHTQNPKLKLAKYQAQLGEIADRLAILYDSNLTFLPCDLDVLSGHPEVAQLSDLADTVKLISEQLLEISGRLDEIGTTTRQLSETEGIDESPVVARVDRDWRAVQAMVEGCLKASLERSLSEEPRWSDTPIVHPRLGEKGEPIIINHPTKPGTPDAWQDTRRTAIFVPGGKAPKLINGVPVLAWVNHPKTAHDWNALELLMPNLKEPPPPKTGLPMASGVVTIETDGRIWMVSPTNKFGGYETTFPKGKLGHKGLTLQANAVKEGFEESGLKVRITGYLGDFERTTSMTRLYLAERVGGDPTDMGWESQAVKLVPRSRLAEFLTNPIDKPLADALRASLTAPGREELFKSWTLDSATRIVATVNGYRRRFGKWPTAILIHSGTAEAIQRYVLTALAWKMLNARLKLILIEEGTIIAQGDDGSSYEYEGGYQTPVDGHRADVWIWGSPL